MTIRKKVVFKYRDCEQVFEYVDENRKVDIETTGAFICKIKKWLDCFSKTEGEDLKLYLNKWNTILKFYLIPDGVNPHIEEGQHYVKLNYQLLDPNKSLTYSQALFLLLGLNAYELGRNIKDFPMLDGDEPVAQPIEMEFWRTPQNQALKESSFIDGNGKITSENLETLTDDNNFFIEPRAFLSNRNIDEIVANKLYELLKDIEYIIGKYEDLWIWNKNKAYRNELSYLAKQLSQKRILKGDCHKELANYIKDPSDAKRPLSSIKNPSNTKHIDNVISQLIT